MTRESLMVAGDRAVLRLSISAIAPIEPRITQPARDESSREGAWYLWRGPRAYRGARAYRNDAAALSARLLETGSVLQD